MAGMLPDNAEMAEYIDCLLKHFGSRLNSWEDKFVRSLKANGPPYSDKQRKACDELMERMARTYRGPERGDVDD